MFENYVVLIIVMLWIRFSVRTYGQRHGMSFRSKLNASKQRFSQNIWLLPLWWCSSYHIIRTVYTLSGLCNPETTFLTPFVDFLRGDWHISDYVIWIQPLHIDINIHQTGLSEKIHEFVRNSFFGRSSDYVIQTRGIFGEKIGRAKK